MLGVADDLLDCCIDRTLYLGSDGSALAERER